MSMVKIQQEPIGRETLEALLKRADGARIALI